MSLSGFTWAAFLVQFGAAAAYALGWAPYVSDYSRYLPPQTSPRKALWFTYAGVFVGAVWLMALGALVAALFTGASPLDAVNQAANGLLPGSGTWLLIAALPGLVTVITVNIYAASLELITMLDSFRAVRPTRRLRVIACSVIAAAGLLGAVALHRGVPCQLRQLPGGVAVPAGAVDVGQPRRLLLRAARPLRGSGDLRAQGWRLRHLGLAGS